ncbi:MAG: hypothetical protein KKB02_00550, partial [Alphaproteobacteria bacterium]|nr:hypothetical protein [Alphaproteobacteria bacterium]
MNADAIHAMNTEAAKFSDVSPKLIADTHATTGAVFALHCDSRADVLAVVDAVLAHGSSDTGKVQDMDGRTICDPDGHVFESFWMNPAAVEGSPDQAALISTIWMAKVRS